MVKHIALREEHDLRRSQGINANLQLFLLAPTLDDKIQQFNLNTMDGLPEDGFVCPWSNLSVITEVEGR